MATHVQCLIIPKYVTVHLINKNLKQPYNIGLCCRKHVSLCIKLESRRAIFILLKKQGLFWICWPVMYDRVDEKLSVNDDFSERN